MSTHNLTITVAVTYRLSVRFAWWVMPYVQSVALFAHLTGLEPDYARVARTVARGTRCTLARTDPLP
jgi:hypothetical protein